MKGTDPMNFRPMLMTNAFLLAVMAGVSAWAMGQIPEGARVPIHWNIEGQPDGFSTGGASLVFMPFLALGVTILMWVVPHLDPRRSNVESSAQFWNATGILLVSFLAYLHGVMTWAALGHPVDVTGSMIPGMSILFMGIGNYLGKTRSNWFGGVRTPWTLSSDYSWEKTHRATGWLFVLSGLAGMGAWLTVGTVPAFIILIGSIIASSIVAVILSYVYWRQDPQRASGA